MNATQYRDFVEQRLIDRVAQSGPSAADLDIWRQGGPTLRAALHGLYAVIPLEARAIAAKTPLGLSLLGSVNAAALLAPDDQPVIFFDWSLPRILMDFCTSLAPDAFANPPFRHYGDVAVVPGEAGRTHFFDVLALNFHMANSWLRLAWAEDDLPRDSVSWFRIMFIFQLYFIVAHELGHVALRHLVPGAFRARHSALLEEEVQVFASNHALEFDADQYAFALVTDASLSAPFDVVDSTTWMEWIDAVFSLFSFLEGTGDVIAGRRPFSGVSSTHPSAFARQERLRARLGHATPNMERLKALLVSLVTDFERRWPEMRLRVMNLGGPLASECFL